MTRIVSGATLRELIKGLRAAGCVQMGNLTRGQLTVSDGDVCVLRAMKKDRAGHWIVTFHKSARVEWEEPQTTAERIAGPDVAPVLEDQHGGSPGVK